MNPENKTFKFSFVGREARAIGITYPINTAIEAESLPLAIEQLYAKYDLLQAIRVNGKRLPFSAIKFEENTCISPVSIQDLD